MLKFCARAADPVYASEIHVAVLLNLKDFSCCVLCKQKSSVAMFAVSASCKGYPGAASNVASLISPEVWPQAAELLLYGCLGVLATIVLILSTTPLATMITMTFGYYMYTAINMRSKLRLLTLVVALDDSSTAFDDEQTHALRSYNHGCMVLQYYSKLGLRACRTIGSAFSLIEPSTHCSYHTCI